MATRALSATGAPTLLRRPAVLAGLFVLALTAVRAAFLAVSPLNLFVDEAQYWAWSRDLAFGYSSKPPLIAWLIAAATAVCGNGEACVRLPSPLFYAGTSAAVFALARAMYDERVAAWSAAIVASLPGVSFSALIISTDVPLLFFWAVALVALWRLVQGAGTGAAVVLGLAVGLATLSKYAGAYFVLCALVYAAAEGRARAVLFGRSGAIALAVALAVIAPNLIWNAANDFATIGHTAGLAVAGGTRFEIMKVLEFYGAQFGVFGPLPFALLTWLALRWIFRPADERARLLMCFALPVLGLMLAEAFFTRAYANWAAVAYVSATVLVVAALVERGPRWLGPTVAFHAGGAVLVYAMLAAGLGLAPFTFGRTDPVSRVTGWDTLAAAVAERAAAYPGAAILVDDRTLAAAMRYYLRDSGRSVISWSPPPADVSVTMIAPPVDAATGRDVLFLPVRFPPEMVAARFATANALEPVFGPMRSGGGRTLRVWRLTGYRAP
ncbi:MAG: glycosyltransferase family 39 protein [Alphaproteobacteria bacterium]|nr:glycosyltransferase family 39 protein [Alphaproteobacteria bacterium]